MNSIKEHANLNDALLEENLYLLLAGMLLEEQTKGEVAPFKSARREFLSNLDDDPRDDDMRQVA